ncbi:MAG TPA: DUF937 domain-containing protein, partial [Puia sp.]|nr:DUF937 domain-containing protein [Puia sp.]
MSLNLLDSVKRLFNSEIVSKAAISLGESESGISKAISGVVPSVLSSIVAKATSGEHGATNILQLAKDAAGSDVLDSMGGLFNNNGKNSFLSAGFDTLKSLFGDKLTSVIHSIAGFAGIQTSSASALLSGVAPAALAVVGQHAITNNISASGLVQSLENSKGQILSALPLSLGSIPGLLGLSNATNSLSGTAKQATSAAAAYVKGAED